MPVDPAEEPRRMVGPARYRIERDVVESGDIETPLVVGGDRLLRVTGGTADMDVIGGVERNQAGVLPAPGAFDRPLDARASDVTGAHRDHREAGPHDPSQANPPLPPPPPAPPSSPPAPRPR